MTPEDPDPDYTPEPPDWVQEYSYPRLVRPDDPPRERRHLELGSHMELADRTLEQLSTVGSVIHTEGNFFRYEGGVFAKLPTSVIYEDVKRRDGWPTGEKNKPLRLRHSDIMSVIASLRETLDEPDFFERQKRGLAFKNGFARLGSELRLVEHSALHRSRYRYDFDFEECAAPLEWLKFLRSVWHGEPDMNERIDCIRQFIGLALVGLCTKMQTSLVLYGEGSNGKSVISEVVTACMPPGSVSSIVPQDLGNDYSRAELAGKLLNVVSELPESDILHNESWKAVVSGDQIKARQIRQAPFMFRPIAGHLYSANRLPGTQDHTLGFWRRMIVLTFNRRFDGESREIGLAKRLIETERAQIVTWALEGAHGATQKGGYTVPRSSQDAVDSWRKEADAVAAFVEECTRPLGNEEPDSAGAERAVLYRHYRSWCDRSGHRPMAVNKFGQRLKSLGVQTSRPWAPGERPRYYLVSLVEEQS